MFKSLSLTFLFRIFSLVDNRLFPIFVLFDFTKLKNVYLEVENNRYTNVSDKLFDIVFDIFFDKVFDIVVLRRHSR